MNEVMVGELSEFAEGGYRVLRVDSFEFGVFRQGDRVVAYENYCPHDGGPVCQGKVIPRDAPYLLERLPHRLLRLVLFEPKQHPGQHLANLVVQAAGDPSPLRLLGV